MRTNKQQSVVEHNPGKKAESPALAPKGAGDETAFGDANYATRLGPQANQAFNPSVGPCHRTTGREAGRLKGNVGPIENATMTWQSDNPPTSHSTTAHSRGLRATRQVRRCRFFSSTAHDRQLETPIR